MQALLFRKIENLRSRGEWADYDLLTHAFGALHLIIEGDRLAGGQTRSQVVADLHALIAMEWPGRDRGSQLELAEAIIDVLLNTRNRYARLSDNHMWAPGSSSGHDPLTFRLVDATGEEDASDPTLKPTPVAINIFQNLFTFDPTDRAAAERYRSERMLRRQDYDEVLYSVERRATSIHGLRGELEDLVRRIRYRVSDVDYAAEVIPQLDDVMTLIGDHVRAEQQFLESVAEHMHPQAPDLARLRRVNDRLWALIESLMVLNQLADSVRTEFEVQQDRQLFTVRRVTVSPEADLLRPLMSLQPGQLCEVLPELIAIFRGARPPQVVNLQTLMDRTAPRRRPAVSDEDEDPFYLGEPEEEADQFDPAILQIVADVLAAVYAPTGLSVLLDAAIAHPVAATFEPEGLALLEWAMALTVAGAYGTTDVVEGDGELLTFDHSRLAVLNRAQPLSHPRISGDDLLVVPVEPPASDT